MTNHKTNRMPNEIDPIAFYEMSHGEVEICNNTITAYERQIRELQADLKRYEKIMSWMVDSGYTVHKSMDGKSYFCYFYSTDPIYGDTPLESIENAILKETKPLV